MLTADVRLVCEIFAQNYLANFDYEPLEHMNVTDRGGKNRNTLVVGAGGARYHFKQPMHLQSQAARSALAREIDFYSLVQSNSIPLLLRVLPKLIYANKNHPFLVIEDLTNARTLWRQFNTESYFPGVIDVCRSLGGVLATVHLALRCTNSSWQSNLPHDPPWVTGLHMPEPALLSTLSLANQQLIKTLQTESIFVEQLNNLRDRWEPTSPIHGDLRSDNILFHPSTSQANEVYHIRFIDWESVQMGDPAWDVAGILQDLVAFWVSSMSGKGESGAEAIVASARCPWLIIQAALAAFWDGYKRAADLRPEIIDGILFRAIPFSAARMTQSAYELAQFLSELPVESVLLLQLAANILSDQESARTRFYDLPLSSASRA